MIINRAQAFRHVIISHANIIMSRKLIFNSAKFIAPLSFFLYKKNLLNLLWSIAHEYIAHVWLVFHIFGFNNFCLFTTVAVNDCVRA